MSTCTKQLLLSMSCMVAVSISLSNGTAAGAVNNPLVAVATAPAAVNPLKASELQLKQMGEAIHRTKSASVDLIRECQQVDEMAGGEIDFVGTDIIPILPDTAEGGGQPIYIPPRKKYIDLHMQQLTQLLPILQDDVNNVKAPDVDEQQRVQASITQMQGLMKNVNAAYQQLIPITKSQPYDSDAIVKAATTLHKAVCDIDNFRKDIYKSYKHDPDKGQGKAND